VKPVFVKLRRLHAQRTAAVVEAAARRHGTHLRLAVCLPAGETRVQTWQQISDTHTHVKRPFVRDYPVSRYQKGKTNLDFTEARDSEWQWNPLGHMQVCTSLQTDNYASTPPLRAGCPSCRPTNSVKALKAVNQRHTTA